MLSRCAFFVFIMGIATGILSATWETANTIIKGKKVSIDYGRLILDRDKAVTDILKMLPPDRVWQAGSGPLTSLLTETDLMIGRKKVPAGFYSLYIYCPEQGEYSLIVNKETVWQYARFREPKLAKRFPTDYTTLCGAKELARIPMKKISAPFSQALIYEFKPSGKGAVLTIFWGDQAWSVKFRPAK